MFDRVARRASRVGLSIGLLALGALGACSDSTAGGTAKVSLLLTDAPGDIKAAVVTISEIDLQGSGGSHVLMNTPVTTDLLTLAGSTQQLVKDAVVPAGTYEQLRFVITGGYVQVDNGDGTTSIYASSPDYSGLPAGSHVTGTLQMPSFGQSGLKVNLPAGGATLASGEKVFLVDFDVSQSFGHQAGDSGRWVMHPVVKATDFQTTGGITVQLTKADAVTMPQLNGTALTLGNFTAVLTASDNSTKSVALTDAGNGIFQAQFPFLAPGSYSLTFTVPTGVTFTTNPTVPQTIALTSAQEDTSKFTLTAVSVAP